MKLVLPRHPGRILLSKNNNFLIYTKNKRYAIIIYMKQITLSINALNNLKSNLEGKGDGFTIKQLRLLDKIITAIEPFVADYASKIDARVKQAQDSAAENATEFQVQQINTLLNKDLDALVAGEGAAQVTVSFEDDWFALIKEIWDNSQGFRGNDAARKVLLDIDTALENAVSVDSQAKKNETEQENSGASGGSPAGETGN